MTGWYLARALGLVALLACTATTVLGATASTGAAGTRARDGRLVRQLVHRSTAAIGLVALVGHVVLLVVDTSAQVGVLAVVVPMASGYRPLAVTVGALAAWTIAFVAGWGAARGRLAGSARAARTWRTVHALAYLGWALAMGHGLLAGTDTGAWWTTSLYVLCAVAVVAALAVRFGRRPADRERDATDPEHRFVRPSVNQPGLRDGRTPTRSRDVEAGAR